MGSREIAALHPPEQAAPYPIEVHHRIRRDEHADYAHTALALNDCVEVVSIQFGNGTWGGEDGAYVLDFLRALRVPAVATLHAVPGAPTPGQRTVISGLVAGADTTIVMSPSAVRVLASSYGIDARRIEVIPHGVPELPLVDPEAVKPALGLEGRAVILSYGLLGPDKGYELAIDALPDVVAAHPSVLYAIVGTTHPNLLQGTGEAYRTGLVDRVRTLGLEGHVRFVDRFVGRVELTRWLEAADVFVTPYPNLDQAVSGTMSYAMGAGRAVVSTPYAYAADLLADGRGVLVPPGSPADLASALNRLLGNDELRAAIGRRAYDHSRPMTWSAVGAEYRRLFARVASVPRGIVPAVPLAPLIA
jgi:glycosyltransferase involved in cell wall biosynthesis